jgi:hypothetical protein
MTVSGGIAREPGSCWRTNTARRFGVWRSCTRARTHGSSASERLSAVRDALAWELGYTDTAPITWRSIRDPTWQVITTEYLHGRDVHERHPAPEGLTFTYGSAGSMPSIGSGVDDGLSRRGLSCRS